MPQCSRGSETRIKHLSGGPRAWRLSDNRHYHAVALGGWCGPAVPSPAFSQLEPLLAQITAPVGRLDFVGDGVCERHLAYFAREIGPLGAPIAEGRAEAVA